VTTEKTEAVKLNVSVRDKRHAAGLRGVGIYFIDHILQIRSRLQSSAW